MVRHQTAGDLVGIEDRGDDARSIGGRFDDTKRVDWIIKIAVIQQEAEAGGAGALVAGQEVRAGAGSIAGPLPARQAALQPPLAPENAWMPWSTSPGPPRPS